MRIKLITVARPQAPQATYEELVGEASSGSPAGASMWRAMRLCPREYALRYEVGLVPETAPPKVALDYGLLVHHLLEHKYRVNDAAMFNRLWELRERAEKAYPDWLGTLDEVQRLLEDYCVFYRDDGLRALMVEETFEMREVTPAGRERLRYTARVDTIVEDRAGDVWLLEHKTAKAATRDLLEGYNVDLQVLGQYYLVRNAQMPFSDRLKGVMVNILVKKKTPEFFRVSCCPSPQLEQAFEQSIRQLAAFRHLARQQGWPQHFGNCNGAPRYFSKCAYEPICSSIPLVSVAALAKAPPPGYVLKQTTKD